MTSPLVTIYTDGGCRSQESIGAWACSLKYKDHYKELSGFVENTTNNIMELTACIKALQTLKRPCNVVLISDSNYVVSGMNKWIKNWIKNDWKTTDKKGVKNQELWKELYALTTVHNVQFKWCKGHSHNKNNARVDFLCNQEMNKARK